MFDVIPKDTLRKLILTLVRLLLIHILQKGQIYERSVNRALEIIVFLSSSTFATASFVVVRFNERHYANWASHFQHKEEVRRQLCAYGEANILIYRIS